MKRIFLCLVLMLCFSIGLYAQSISGQVRVYKIGNFDFIAIKDIETNMGKEILLKPMAPVVARLMANNQNPSSINTFVLKNKEQTVLFDTGVGEGGALLNNLKAAGFEPEDFDMIIITHMHTDHIGGLLSASGKKVFEKAAVYVNDKELDYWTNSITQDPGTASMAKNVRALYGDDLKTFKWGENIIPEIKSVAAPGHTPGHTVYEIESEGEKMIVIADLVHVLKVQLADPNMAVTFDINPRDAIDSRKKIFMEVSKNKTRVAGMHIHFPGVGTIIESTGGEFVFSPSVK